MKKLVKYLYNYSIITTIMNNHLNNDILLFCNLVMFVDILCSTISHY